MNMVEITCYVCEGKGKRDYGLVSEGIYPNHETWYEGINTCYQCNGTGKIKEPQLTTYEIVEILIEETNQILNESKNDILNEEQLKKIIQKAKEMTKVANEALAVIQKGK